MKTMAKNTYQIWNFRCVNKELRNTPSIITINTTPFGFIFLLGVT